MIRLYAQALEAERKRSMSFELTDLDQRLLRFAGLFRERLMQLEVDSPLEQALDTCWATLGECFAPEEVPVRRDILDRHMPAAARTGA
jgi:V/A-type H+-transporting ATPase subunit B